MNPREIAKKTLKILDERGWGRGSPFFVDGEVCLAAAATIAVYGSHGGFKKGTDLTNYEQGEYVTGPSWSYVGSGAEPDYVRFIEEFHDWLMPGYENYSITRKVVSVAAWNDFHTEVQARRALKIFSEGTPLISEKKSTLNSE